MGPPTNKLDTVPIVTRTLTVRELYSTLRAGIRSIFPNEVWVNGSISDLNRSPNGHVYFNLIDNGQEVGRAAQEILPVVLFSSTRAQVNAILRKSRSIRMDDEVEIRIRGQVNFYPAQGRIQLVMSLIDPSYTLGQAEIARTAVLKRLASDGLLQTNAMHEMPLLPLRINLITSGQSAAHVDFMHELERSPFQFKVNLFDSRVQGPGATDELVGCITTAQNEADVVVIIRGGGARTDLAIFDNEDLARSIAQCRRPVLVGIGHEIDRSIADEVAHTSEKTPTAAANYLVERVRSTQARLDTLSARLTTASQRSLHHSDQQLHVLASRLQHGTRHSTAQAASRLDDITSSLVKLPGRILEKASTELDHVAAHLDALDPRQTLKRGWSITETDKGELITDVSTLKPGTILVTHFAMGTVTSTVIGTKPTEPQP